MRSVQRASPYLAASTALLGILLFGLAVAYTFDRQQSVDRKLCAQTIENRDAIRSTWNAARVLILSGQTDAERIARTNEFFDRILRPIPRLECVDNRPVRKGL